MRKAQKAQLLEILQTLREAHKVIKQHFKRHELEAAHILFGECQQTAIQLGELIETSEGEDCPAVRALEDYCEEIYRASEQARISKTLNDALNYVENSIKTNIPVRFEVVFFPYKASMWDALESVWKAASQDPDCDAYVVPIPYYEMNPDGSLGKLHYEGGKYPTYVPVVDWRTYDLEKRCPDVAFIHNPYDDQNLVTQVHSTYFSRNLRGHVGLLCYIPYFVVAGEISPHFAYLPAVLNSDFTIVESENVRQQYLSVWEKLVQQNKVSVESFKAIKNRILPLGSPKYDAVRASGNEDLPENWKRLIFKGDGTRKKVIFYNTSISNMLTNTVDEGGNLSDRYLKKLESVLDYFQCRDDVVLLWRPHPLLEQTFASMRPQFLKSYCQLVQDYKKAGYGIYDEESDLHRAIEISDAYYGDGSSVVALWEKTQKPLLIENVRVISYRQRIPVGYPCFDGDAFWCTALDFNGLFRVDKDSLNIHYVGSFPNEKMEVQVLSSRAVECNGKLYFSPYNAENIGVYDKESEKFFSIPFRFKKNTYINTGKYANAFVWEDNIIMIGAMQPYILKIDTQTNCITVIDEWERQLKAHKNINYFSAGIWGCQIKNKLYLPSYDAMVIFDINDCTSEFHPFPEKGRKYDRCIPVGDQIWLCATSSPFVGVYKIQTGQMSEFVNPFGIGGFCDLRQHKSDIYCFSFLGKQILKINSHTNKMELFHEKEEAMPANIVGNKIYALSPVRIGEASVINLETMEQHVKALDCPDDVPAINYKKAFEELKNFYNFTFEDAYLNLNAFLELVQKSTRKSCEIEHCGEKIFQYTKEKLL